MEIGKNYNVVYGLKYDIEYENDVKCIKITPLSYQIERQNGKTGLIKKDSIMELKEVTINSNGEKILKTIIDCKTSV